MYANVDGYAQMTVEVDDSNLEELMAEWVLEGKIWQSSTSRELPFFIKVKDDIDKAWSGGLPKNKPHEEKESYEVHILPESLKVLAEKGKIGGFAPALGNMRSVLIRREVVAQSEW